MEEPRITIANGADSGLPRKKKTRRAKRDRSKYTPYAALSWEERKASDEKDDEQKTAPVSLVETRVSASKKRKRNKKREQPPPPPRNTTQFILEQHSNELFPVPVFGSTSGEDDGSSEEQDTVDIKSFQQMFEGAVYDDLDSCSMEELKEKLRERDQIIQRLELDLHELKHPSRNGKR